MIEIDGSQGEGGGQILRTSLALSMVTGQAFRIGNLRAGRSKPGLMRQHLTSVEAARTVCSGTVVGAALGATSLEFTPGRIRGGDYNFSIGTAGSTTLVLQTILPALVTADEASTVSLSGGTHNMHAPSVHFLQHAFLPLINRMGPRVTLSLERHGFYPAGGGQIRVTVAPAQRLEPLEIMSASPIIARRGVATIAGLPPSIGHREVAVLKEVLGWEGACFEMEQLEDRVGPGNIVSVEVSRAELTEVFTGFGERGVSAERVAGSTAEEVQAYLAAEVPVWRHLADQLMLPLALAGGGSFVTGALSGHAVTNARVIETFLPVRVQQSDEVDGVSVVRIVA